MFPVLRNPFNYHGMLALLMGRDNAAKPVSQLSCPSVRLHAARVGDFHILRCIRTSTAYRSVWMDRANPELPLDPQPEVSVRAE